MLKCSWERIKMYILMMRVKLDLHVILHDTVQFNNNSALSETLHAAV